MIFLKSVKFSSLHSENNWKFISHFSTCIL